MFLFSRFWSNTFTAITLSLAIASCSPATLLSSPVPQISQENEATNEQEQTQSQQWRRMTAEEEERVWEFILNSPLGIAALNQLAIEGFIAPDCPKTFYLNEKYGDFQSLLQVQCSTARGVSIALNYEEMRVIFNRFEDNIESFEVERISMPEKPPSIELPE